MIIAILILLIVVTVAAAVFYLLRTRRLFNKFREELDDTFSRIESRLVYGSPEFNYSTPRDLTWAVMCTYNRKDLLRSTLNTLRAYEPGLPILVVDNGSSDGTQQLLIEMLREKKINKLILNQHEEVPQWQKGFALTQAFKIISLEFPKYIVWLDDDIEISRPFVEDAKTILRTLSAKNVKVINMTDNELEETHHPAIEKISVQLSQGEEEIKIRRTFNGQFNFISKDFLRELGYPPKDEGVYAIEDWYYSRLLPQKDYRVAVLVAGIHLGHDSKRGEKEREIRSQQDS